MPPSQLVGVLRLLSPPAPSQVTVAADANRSMPSSASMQTALRTFPLVTFRLRLLIAMPPRCRLLPYDVRRVPSIASLGRRYTRGTIRHRVVTRSLSAKKCGQAPDGN